ncbi:RICIN domain-containing protein [Streptomyces sp. NPDC005533]|uniref:RICIN domain-containing protein n=1 Tax=Streptomyces sp. NPDC005533 TaxID=3364723 RepID=UPI00368EE3F0
MRRRTLLLALLICLLASLGLAPVSTSAGPCDIFPDGKCPTFGDPQRPPTFGSGWWNIKSGFTQDLVLAAPWELGLRELHPRPGRHRITLQPNRNEEGQQFRFRPVNGSFQIEVRNTGLCLEGSTKQDGSAIIRQNYCDTPSNAQNWKIEPRGPSGFFRIRSTRGRDGTAVGGRCLDAASASRTVPPTGAYLQEFSCHDGENQAWAFVDASPAPFVR